MGACGRSSKSRLVVTPFACSGHAFLVGKEAKVCHLPSSNRRYCPVPAPSRLCGSALLGLALVLRLPSIVASAHLRYPCDMSPQRQPPHNHSRDEARSALDALPLPAISTWKRRAASAPNQRLPKASSLVVVVPAARQAGQRARATSDTEIAIGHAPSLVSPWHESDQRHRRPRWRSEGVRHAKKSQSTSSAPLAVYGTAEPDDADREESQVDLAPSTCRPESDSSHCSLSEEISSSSTTSSTLTLSSCEDRAEDTGDARGMGDQRERADPLKFLDPDSPAVTAETIHRTIAEAAAHWRESTLPTPPGSAASSSSSSAGLRSVKSEAAFELDTEPSTSPEQSEDGDVNPNSAPAKKPFAAPPDAAAPGDPPLGRPSKARQRQGRNHLQADEKEYRYGTPEMPRGNAHLPHLPPNALTPRLPNLGQGHAKHLPRAEKLPLTGYQLLAAELSSHPRGGSRGRRRRGDEERSDGGSSSSPRGEDGGEGLGVPEPSVQPIYRRFEALNHRLLLHLQDELSELEEQLHRLDTADTQTRRLQNSILPASRRAEHMAGGELQWHKTDILGKIGFKLGQYNHVLSSFKATQELPSPSLPEVNAYRAYLATHKPIAEIETRFLDPEEDLISLAPPRRDHWASSTSGWDSDRDSAQAYSTVSDEALTPMPNDSHHAGAGTRSRRGSSTKQYKSESGSSGPPSDSSSVSTVRECETASTAATPPPKPKVDVLADKAGRRRPLWLAVVSAAVALAVAVLACGFGGDFRGALAAVLVIVHALVLIKSGIVRW
ncbi:hypothetical protein VTK73DRAFT_9923 [Phialemonium thermophilum]|uniref:DUF6594 domain-containing protein n=1 Tax=Phialemonium thermophilum TaxID=223376 RepID=A0ABR3VZE5_9PEZI